MGSESDREIVHDDGTVTDKRDGVRRTYDEHVAHVLGDVGMSPSTGNGARYVPEPTRAPSTRRVVALSALTSAAVVGGAWLLHVVR